MLKMRLGGGFELSVPMGPPLVIGHETPRARPIVGGQTCQNMNPDGPHSHALQAESSGPEELWQRLGRRT